MLGPLDVESIFIGTTILDLVARVLLRMGESTAFVLILYLEDRPGEFED
jgi:hypothetical protein